VKRIAVAVSVFLIVASAALCLAQAASFGPETARGGNGTQCGSITCHSNTHCCFSCTGDPICLNPGVMCPVCP
jgi:hypothetical protein